MLITKSHPSVMSSTGQKPHIFKLELCKTGNNNNASLLRSWNQQMFGISLYKSLQ